MALGKSVSIKEFLEDNNIDKFDVVRNPHTQKLFVTADSKVLGAVSLKWDQSKPSEFIEIEDDTTGEILWCLHNPSTENVVASFTL